MVFFIVIPLFIAIKHNISVISTKLPTIVLFAAKILKLQY